MQFFALSALALSLIGRCLAEPIPIGALHRDDLPARMVIPVRQFDRLPGGDLNAFWPCFRCSLECSAVVIGCGVVCGAAEIDGPLCGLCIAGAGGSKACVECWPRCHNEPGANFFMRHPIPRLNKGH